MSKLLIVGDLIVDSTCYVKVPRLSPEAPVPNAFLVEHRNTPGGAGLAAAYAQKHKKDYVFYTATDGEIGHPTLWENQINSISCSCKANVVKTRYVDLKSGYQLVRVDNDMIAAGFGEPETILVQVEKLLSTESFGAVLFLDYQKGFFTPPLAHNLIKLANKYTKFSYVDTKGNPNDFVKASYLKLNEKENEAIREQWECDNDKLVSRLHLQGLITTLGEWGARYDGKGKAFSVLPQSIDRGIANVSGAGDVFDIEFCFALLEGLDIESTLQTAVNKASTYVYEDLRTRL